MRKIYSILLTLVVVLSLVGCKENTPEDQKANDYCEGLEDCYVLSDEEAINEVKYRNDMVYLEMTNVELQQVYDIYQSYTFNYFQDTEMEDISSIGNIIGVFNAFYRNLDLSQNNSLKDVKNYFDNQYTLNDFKIDELVENDTQYLEVDDNEFHYLYKTDANLITYEIVHWGIQKFTFNIATNSMSNYNYEYTNNYMLNEDNQSDTVHFSEDNLSYHEETMFADDLKTVDVIYLNNAGGYCLEIDNSGSISSGRSYQDNYGRYNVMYNYFEVEYNTETGLFDIYDELYDVEVSVTYGDFFKTVLDHPNLDTEVETWMSQELSEDFVIDYFTK